MACMISACVFITNGPYCATGSPMGRPCSTRHSTAVVPVLVRVQSSVARTCSAAWRSTSCGPTRRLSPTKKYSMRCVVSPFAAGSVHSAPGSRCSVQMATSPSGWEAQNSGGGGSGSGAPGSAPDTAVTVVARPAASWCTRRGMRSFHSMGKCGAATKTRGRAQRIGMVDETLAHQRHRLKTPVRVARKARHGVAVVHAPAVLAAEVAADLAVFNRHGGAERCVACRVGIVVVGAEKKRVERGPLRTEQLGAHDGHQSGACCSRCGRRHTGAPHVVHRHDRAVCLWNMEPMVPEQKCCGWNSAMRRAGQWGLCTACSYRTPRDDLHNPLRSAIARPRAG